MTVSFVLPPDGEASTTPEQRGLARDEVRLLVVRPDVVEHHVFRDLPDLLEPGDLLVVNTSATVPAALDAVRADGTAVLLHVAAPLSDDRWLVELRSAAGPDRSGRAGEVLRLPGGLLLRLLDQEPAGRLWCGRVDPPVPLVGYLHEHGRPVRYAHLTGPVPLADLQNVYADEPGSAEMASAGRPLTARVLARLVPRGVAVAPVVLHAGLSSQEAGEPPLPERYAVPAATARLVTATRAGGGRVVAVGTTVVRALESAVGADAQVAARTGWTDLVLGPDRPARVVDGLVSGLHTPEASHLLLLEAVAGRALVQRAYDAAVAGGYLWHELGDSSLFLRGRGGDAGAPHRQSACAGDRR